MVAVSNGSRGLRAGVLRCETALEEKDREPEAEGRAASMASCRRAPRRGAGPFLDRPRRELQASPVEAARVDMVGAGSDGEKTGSED